MRKAPKPSGSTRLLRAIHSTCSPSSAVPRSRSVGLQSAQRAPRWAASAEVAERLLGRRGHLEVAHASARPVGGAASLERNSSATTLSCSIRTVARRAKPLHCRGGKLTGRFPIAFSSPNRKGRTLRILLTASQQNPGPPRSSSCAAASVHCSVREPTPLEVRPLRAGLRRRRGLARWPAS